MANIMYTWFVSLIVIGLIVFYQTINNNKFDQLAKQNNCKWESHERGIFHTTSHHLVCQ